MLELANKLFDVSDFPARWTCGNWTETHGWLHILSDTAIFGAYAAIPLSIAFYIRKRPDVSIPLIGWLFAAFIFSCGFGHLLEATIFWHPWYRFSGVVKMITAIVSWITVACVIYYLPAALKVPGALKLNEQLLKEISNRKAIEAALAANQEHLSAILRAAPTGLLSIDREGKILSANPKAHELFGSPSPQLEGRNIDTFIPDTPHLKDPHTQDDPEKNGTTPRQTECTATRADGSVFPAQLQLTAYDDSGEARILATISDISERKAFEKQLQANQRELERSNQELSQFASAASHDLRSPLRAIDNLATWIDQDAGPSLGQESRDDLRTLRSRARRMLNLLDSLLEYSRIQRAQNFEEAVPVAEVINELVELQGFGDSFTIEVQGEMPTLLGAKAALSRVFGNLISNAIKHHSSATGRVDIFCRKGPDSYEFEVRDDGPGIPPEDQVRVFEMFQTLKPTNDTENSGNGMGLALVKRTIENHGGRIRIESSAGKGTAVIFTWPKNPSLQ